VKVENGEVWLADRPVGLSAPDAASGNATLYFRPHDVELLSGCSGCLAGTVVASRRVAGTRRVELEIGGERQRVEIELPVDHPAAQKSRVAFRPGRWKLFFSDQAGSSFAPPEQNPRQNEKTLPPDIRKRRMADAGPLI
ncbi:TOBE-like domain-containing protein, partial [Mesorhizobium sp. BR1-1-2]|uniref:TOBE-like domain-containing protein n=1 Tax=Mesorhizobium sp. BR1-1-2 TaxID=2876652 RepID=UPI001CCD3688